MTPGDEIRGVASASPSPCKALVFKDFQPVVLDQALAASGLTVTAALAIAGHRQHVVRRIEGKALGQARLDAAEDAPDPVVAIARGAIADVFNALEIARLVILVAPPQDGAALHAAARLGVNLIAQRGPSAGALPMNMTIF